MKHKYKKPKWLIGSKNVQPKWVKDYYQELDAKKDHKLSASRKDNIEGKDIYQSFKWRKHRDRYIKRNPLCEVCNEIGLVTEAKVVDHVIPIRSPHYGSIWSEANWMSLCQLCHNTKRKRESQGKVIKGKLDENNELIPIDRFEIPQ